MKLVHIDAWAVSSGDGPGDDHVGHIVSLGCGRYFAIDDLAGGIDHGATKDFNSKEDAVAWLKRAWERGLE